MIKLKPSEAERLASLIDRLVRPKSDADADEVLHWLRRLRGGRS